MAIVYKDGKPVVVTTPEAGGEEGGEQQHQETPEMTRRKFMRSTFLGTMSAFTIGAGGTFLLFFWPKKVGTFGSTVSAGDLKDFPAGSVTPVRDGRFYLVHLQPEDGGGLMALYWKCVHLGCTVPWKPEEEGSYGGKTYKGIFHCPCHGSLYLYNGQNFGGPAPRPLDYMEVKVAAGRVQVNTGKIAKRDKFDKSQVTAV